MPRQNSSSHTPSPTPPPAPWMKAVFIAEIALILVIAAVGWEHWEMAGHEFAKQSREANQKREDNRQIEQKNKNLEKFLTKFNSDEEFRLRVARQRLGYTQEGEIVFRIDPPPAGRTGDAHRP